MKKATSLIIALILLLNIFSVAGFAAKTKNYLLLGDSIAYGQGVVNSEQACYGKVVADTNGYKYTNYAVSGFPSAALLDHLSVDYVETAVKKADIIQISIGGNDFLTSNLFTLLLGGVFGITFQFDEIQKTFQKNFAQIIKEIKELNPKATILVQTVYNPSNYFLQKVYQIGVDRINDTIKAYLKKNPKAFTIVDVENRFKGHTDCIAVDKIHPNAKGNLEIAKLTLEVLKELGLGKTTTPRILEKGIDWQKIGFNMKKTSDYVEVIFFRILGKIYK